MKMKERKLDDKIVDARTYYNKRHNIEGCMVLVTKGKFSDGTTAYFIEAFTKKSGTVSGETSLKNAIAYGRSLARDNLRARGHRYQLAETLRAVAEAVRE